MKRKSATIRKVVKGARKADIPVSVCGEMASDPLLAVILVGLGITELSMNPTAVPRVKAAIREVDSRSVASLVQDLLQADSLADIHARVEKGVKLNELARIAPE